MMKKKKPKGNIWRSKIRKKIKKIRNEISIRTTALRESIEQNRKRVIEMMNKNKINSKKDENKKMKKKIISKIIILIIIEIKK